MKSTRNMIKHFKKKSLRGPSGGGSLTKPKKPPRPSRNKPETSEHESPPNPENASRSSIDYGSGTMKGRPILFHRVHSENVQLLCNKRRAKRIESFCKGICFGDRPVGIGERIYIKFAEVSTSWSGVLRVGFTSHDPTTINPSELPRYACPDLTYKPGYWAKALPERYAEQGTVLFYYVTRSGDVMFGINGEEKGVFFGAVSTNCNLWPLLDIYGNTTCMEFVEGWQLNNLGTNTALTSGGSMTQQDVDHAFQSLNISQPSTPQPMLGLQCSSMPTLPIGANTSALNLNSISSLTLPPVRYHLDVHFVPLPFHHTMGRNVCLSSDRTIAVRLVEEYCNGYVFTNRPLLCGEKLVIQILSLETEYTGGLAFGMTSCDPTVITPEQLPDDSDLLLDRPEYWIVNKDVCTNPEVGDELSFHLTSEGEVRYGKNGHYIATLMYIDKTLPMWAFFDVYGNTQKIHSLGVISPDAQAGQGSGLTVALPPPRNPSVSSLPGTQAAGMTTTPPPRPPPPRASPSGSINRNSSPVGQAEAQPPTSPPSLPPKQFRQQAQTSPLHAASLLASAQTSPLHPASLMASARSVGSPLPPPLLPMPVQPPPTVPERPNIRSAGGTIRLVAPPSAQARTSKPAPVLPMASKPLQVSPVHRQMPEPASPTPTSSMEDHDEVYDNESNECKVCMNNDVDCVLYMCGHMCLCYICAQDIKNKHNLCPICRQEIKDIIRIYRS